MRHGYTILNQSVKVLTEYGLPHLRKPRILTPRYSYYLSILGLRRWGYKKCRTKSKMTTLRIFKKNEGKGHYFWNTPRISLRNELTTKSCIWSFFLRQKRIQLLSTNAFKQCTYDKIFFSANLCNIKQEISIENIQTV